MAELANLNRERLLERFLRYVKVNTTANAETDEYPSSQGQWELGKIVLGELQELGAEDAHVDDYGLVWGMIPGNVEGASTIAWNSHLDTSPETTGDNVKPQVIESYEGGDIPLPGDESKIITVAESPELKELIGKTLITTDGTTLLGGDDKAGIAIIMEAANYLMEHPEIPHGPIRILFTCDEEIGRGVNHVDIEKVGAVAAYTLDGGGAGDIDVETFSADGLTVKVKGVNIHPSIAKDRMVNALRAAGAFLERLPADQAPETTEDRAGFIHPYVLDGGVAEVTIKILLRDFDTAQLEVKADLVRGIASQVEQDYPGISIDVDHQKQYRNMADGLPKEPRAVEFAKQAHDQLNLEYRLSSIRGGTDGSMLTEKGLPTPNLSSGQHTQHSPLEWACLDEMIQQGQVLIQTAVIWGQN
ncbi:MAG: peptidase T [Planctomycetaceae bacterium]|nr:peptidase T [Planctomycetaceae bacterium]|tara:strand:+ start:712 stop:1959 length:1248 start_codon:yes stop_codon:yes gene_type:complete